jgi:menaquinone-specific isochorismate synthase
VSLRVRTVPLDDDRPLLDLTPLPAETVAWVRKGDGLVGWGEAVRIEPGPGTDRFLRTDAALRAVAADAEVEDAVGAPGTGLVGLGSFTFDANAGGSILIVPRVIVGRHEGTTWLTTIDPEHAAPTPGPATSPPAPPARDRPRFAGSSNPDLRWLEAVADAAARIRAGELDKVVLARDHAIWSHEPFDPLDLARRLAQRFPRCHTFVLDGLVGATPELLLRRTGRHVASRVLAGTTGRSDDEVEDAALGAALLASEKDRLEHALAADSVLEVLALRCDELVHDAAPRLLRLDNVQHLATTFEGELHGPMRPADGDAFDLEDRAAGADAADEPHDANAADAADAADGPTRVESSLEIVAALHPTAAVGGTPREEALAVIRACEGMDRGRYAAPVGWTTPDGDGEWGIALRCAELSGARARLFAGGGIVGASLPEDELQETRLKLLAMQAVLDATPHTD